MDFLDCVTKDLDHVSRERDRFIELYEASLFWCIDDPLTEWIPRFFASATDGDRRTFAGKIHQSLRGLKQSGQQEIWGKWLRQYWLNRLDGIPAPLANEETEQMLEWLPDLSEVFPDAVNLALRMPKPRLDHPMLLFLLRREESEITQRYPTAVAELISYLLDCPEHGSTFFNLTEVLSNLDADKIAPDVRARLIERLIANGYDATALTTARVTQPVD